VSIKSSTKVVYLHVHSVYSRFI